MEVPIDPKANSQFWAGIDAAIGITRTLPDFKHERWETYGNLFGYENRRTGEFAIAELSTDATVPIYVRLVAAERAIMRGRVVQTLANLCNMTGARFYDPPNPPDRAIAP